MKLLVLHVDTVAIWDVKEGEIINELRYVIYTLWDVRIHPVAVL